MIILYATGYKVKLTEGEKTTAKKNDIFKMIKDFKKNSGLLFLCLPMIIYLFIFNYIPMFGAVLAFKNFRYDKGIFGSDWAGLDNFKFFFNSQDAWRITSNTLMYNSIFIIINLVVAITFALLLYEIKNKKLLKFYQTTMFFPHFLSWVVVAFITYGFFNARSGILNQLLKTIGKQPLDWYNTPSLWVYIFPLANLWKGVGMATLIYYACLMGIDPSYYEAASIEGANKWQMTTNITLPFLYPLATMLTILAIGNIFNSDFGLFYQLPMNSPMLYSTTDVIDTYVFRSLKELGNIGMSSAAGLYKSVVGFILVLLTNYIAKKSNPENALF